MVCPSICCLLLSTHRSPVRNRAKEIAELLSDLDRVRQERRKAKFNKNKYTGLGNDGSFGSGGSLYSAQEVTLS
jgi:hypothetical protein